MSEYFETSNGFISARELESRKRKISEWKTEQQRLQRLIDFYQSIVDSAKPDTTTFAELGKKRGI